MGDKKVHRDEFYTDVRPTLFDGRLRPLQVQGMDAILNEWEARWQQRTPLTQLAYVFATPWLETDKTMQPIHEYGNRAYFMRMYDKTGARPKKAAELGNTEVGDGAKFPGMGLVQSTGRGNARKATKRMRELGIIDETVDFEKNPELLMLPQYAVPMLFIGMEEGWFTGVRLDNVIDEKIDGDEHADFLKARRIINGTDRAERIATAADLFLKALVKAYH